MAATYEAFVSWLGREQARGAQVQAAKAARHPRGRAAFREIATPNGDSWYEPGIGVRIRVELQQAQRVHRIVVGDAPYTQRRGAWQGKTPPTLVQQAVARQGFAWAFGWDEPSAGKASTAGHAAAIEALSVTVPLWLRQNGVYVDEPVRVEDMAGTVLSWPSEDGAYEVLLQTGPRGTVEARGRFKAPSVPAIVTPMTKAHDPARLFPASWLNSLKRRVMELSLRMERMVVQCPPGRGTHTVQGESEDYDQSILDRVLGSVQRGAVWDKLAEYAHKVLQKHRVVLGKRLGCGTFACAYNLQGEEDRVAKLSGDPAEAAAWARVLSLAKGKPWPQGLIRTYCVEAFATPAPQSIVQVEGTNRRARPNRRMYLMLQDRAGALTAAEMEFLGHEENTNEILGAAGIAGHEGSLANAVGQAVFADVNWQAVQALVSTIRWLRKQGIVWHDLHNGNVMGRGEGADRRVVIVDLGASEAPPTRIPVVREK